MIDKISAWNNIGFATGSMFGPIIGGKLKDEYGYRQACDIICVVALIGAVLNLIISVIPEIVCGKSK